MEMSPHTSVLAWRLPGTGEPGGLPSMGSHRVGHDWSDLAAAAAAYMQESAHDTCTAWWICTKCTHPPNHPDRQTEHHQQFRTTLSHPFWSLPTHTTLLTFTSTDGFGLLLCTLYEWTRVCYFGFCMFCSVLCYEIHILVYICRPSILIAIESSIVWLCCHWLVHSTTDEHLDNSQFGALLNSASGNTQVYGSWWT